MDDSSPGSMAESGTAGGVALLHEEAENPKIASKTPQSVVEIGKTVKINDLEELCPPDLQSSNGSPVQLIKSPCDQREYDILMLDNQIHVIVVSDPLATKCAAALSVQAGSLLDPKELPGLAHLCQHLITGRRDHKNEENPIGHFESFVKTHEGEYSAITSKDSTTFSFDIAATYFDVALSQFAQLFLTLSNFTDDDIERGIKAVDVEFDKNLPLDEQRRTRVDQSCSRRDHPYGQFDCGNTLSLWTRPQGSSMNLRVLLSSFYSTYYSGNLMSLVVLSHRSCPELQILIEDFFGGVRNMNAIVPSWPFSPYGTDQVKTKIELVPITDVQKLHLIFPTPDYTQEYKAGIIPYMEFTLCHKGSGSLLSLLREENWSRRLKIDYKVPGRGFGFFTIELELTPSGLKNIYNVIHHVFQYLKMLRLEGPQRWIWNEVRFLKDARFQFLDKEPPLPYVKKLATLMPNYPRHHCLIANHILRDYKPTLIRSFLNCLVPAQMRMIVSTKQNDRIANQAEEWYGAKYKYSIIDNDHIKKWKNCVVHDDLRLPSPNRFIPISFELRPRDSKSVGVTPRIIEDNPLSRVWFLQDSEFDLPTATIILTIQSPLPKQQASYFNSTRLIEKVMMDSLREIMCDAKNAGLIAKIETTLTGLTITTHGYDNKLSMFFDYVLNSLFHFCSVGKVGRRYKDIKDEYVQHLTDWREEEPYIHAVEYVWEILNSHTWSPDQLLQAMTTDDISPFHLMLYCQQFLSNVKLVWMFYGNLTEGEALGTYRSSMKYFEMLGSVPLPPNEVMGGQEAVLPAQTTTVFHAEHPTHCESCTVILLQTGHGSLTETVMTELIESLLKGPAIQLLKTGEQIVWTEVRKSRATLGIQIILQDERDPSELENRMEDFLYHMEEQIERMSKDEFSQFRSALINRKLERPKSMKNRGLLIFEEILRENYFHKHTQEILELEKIQLSDVIQFYKERIVPDGPQRKKLCVQVASVLEKDNIVLLQSNSTEVRNPVTETKSADFTSTLPSPNHNTESLRGLLGPDPNEPPVVEFTPQIGVNQSPVDAPIPILSAHNGKKITPSLTTGNHPHTSILKKVISASEVMKMISEERKPSTHITLSVRSPKILGPASSIKIPPAQNQRPRSATPTPQTATPNRQLSPSTGNPQRPRTAIGNSPPNIKQNVQQGNFATKPKIRTKNPFPIRQNPMSRPKWISPMTNAMTTPSSHKDDIVGLKWSPQMNKSFVLRENLIIARSFVTSQNLSFTERPQLSNLRAARQMTRFQRPTDAGSRGNPTSSTPSTIVRKYQTHRSSIISNSTAIQEMNGSRFGKKISSLTTRTPNPPQTNLYPGFLQHSPYNRNKINSNPKTTVRSSVIPAKKETIGPPTSAGNKENWDFRDYDFDFDEEIKRLRSLKKFLHHKEEESRLALNSDPDAQAASEIVVKKPEMKPGFNLQTEIRRVKNIKRILDEDIFKPSVPNTTTPISNNYMTSRSNSRRYIHQQQQQPLQQKVAPISNNDTNISVHDVEKEIQRLKNIKKYLDGDTRELNLHTVEYTVFVVNQVILNDQKGAKDLISRFLAASASKTKKMHQQPKTVVKTNPATQNQTSSMMPFFHTIQNSPPVQNAVISTLNPQAHIPTISKESQKIVSRMLQQQQNSTSSKNAKLIESSAATKILRDMTVQEMTGFSKINVTSRNSETIVLPKSFNGSLKEMESSATPSQRLFEQSVKLSDPRKLKSDTSIRKKTSSKISRTPSGKNSSNVSGSTIPIMEKSTKSPKIHVPSHFSIKKRLVGKRNLSKVKVQHALNKKTTIVSLPKVKGQTSKKEMKMVPIGKKDLVVKGQTVKIKSSTAGKKTNEMKKIDPKPKPKVNQIPIMIDPLKKSEEGKVNKIKLEGKVTTITVTHLHLYLGPRDLYLTPTKGHIFGSEGGANF